MFKIKDKVFYPKYGVGTVTDIKTVEDPENPYLTYVIQLNITNGNIFLPVDEAENLGLRALCPPEGIDKVLNTLTSKEEMDIKESWKDRKKELEQLFFQGDIYDAAFLVKVLYQKHQVKPLGTGERKIYDSTLCFLSDEIACVKEIDPITSEHLIAESLLLSLES